MAQDLVVTEQNYPNILEEIHDAFWPIPFENSAFQTEQFIIGGSITPERAYRAIGLRMQDRLRALREAQYNRAKEDIDIEELQAKVLNSDNAFEIRRAQLDIGFKLDGRGFTNKLIHDALAELNVLYKHFKVLPKYTREQFEAGERAHFEERLNRQVHNIVGAHEAQINMRIPNKDGDPVGDFLNIVKFELEHQGTQGQLTKI